MPLIPLLASAGGTNATATPAAVATIAALPAPSLQTDERTNPATIATTSALPAPTVGTGTSTQPATVATVAAVPSPTVSAGGNATVNPATIATVAAVGAAQASSALAVYAFTGSSPNATTTTGNVTVGAVTANTDVALSYITTSYSSQPALQASTVTVTSTTAAAAITNGHHVNFTLTPDSGYALDLAGLSFRVAKGGASVRGVVVRSSLDGYAADLYSADVSTVRPTWTPVSIDLSSVPPTQSAVTFRIYLYTATVAQFVEFDDVTVTGGLVAAPATISWMGQTWDVAQRAPAGDFVNAFDRTMVELNSSGHLVLRVRNFGGGTIRGGEVASQLTGRGYGVYTWAMDGQTSSMHANLVLGGLFTYDSNAATPGRNEIDSAEQFTDVGGTVKLKHNTWMAEPGNPTLRGPWNAALVGGNPIVTLTDTSQTNVLIWEPTRVTFRTYHGLSTAVGNLFRESILNAGDAVTVNGIATTAVIPTPATERVYFNLWVRPDWYANSDPATVTDYEVAVRSYTFTPATATIATVTALPAPSVRTGSTVSAASLATVAAVPAATLKTGSTTTPAVIATVASLPAPAVSVGSNATPTPAVIATVAAVGIPVIATGSTVTSASVVTTAVLPASTVKTGSTAAPVAVTTVAALPAPSISASGNTTVPAVVIATVASIPSASLSTGERVSAAVIVTVTALPAPVVQTGGKATPATVVTVAAVGAAGLSTGQRVTATTVVTVAALPAPAVAAETRTVVGAITTVAAVPAPTLKTGSTLAAQAIATYAAVGAALVQIIIPAVYGTGAVGHGLAATGRPGTATAPSGRPGRALVASGNSGRG